MLRAMSRVPVAQKQLFAPPSVTQSPTRWHATAIGVTDSHISKCNRDARNAEGKESLTVLFTSI